MTIEEKLNRLSLSTMSRNLETTLSEAARRLTGLRVSAHRH